MIYDTSGAVLSDKDGDIVISNKAVLAAEPHTPEHHKTSTLRKLIPNKKAKGQASPKSPGNYLHLTLNK